MSTTPLTADTTAYTADTIILTADMTLISATGTAVAAGRPRKKISLPEWHEEPFWAPNALEIEMRRRRRQCESLIIGGAL
jgi:hypothetical protein